MRMIHKILIAALFGFWAVMSSAIIVNFTCPFPDKVEFYPMDNQDYFAISQINVVKPKDYSAFYLQATTRASHPIPLNKVVYSRNRLDCYYGQDNELDLSTDDDMEFAYCYFIHNGGKNECVGDPMQCEISCDVL